MSRLYEVDPDADVLLIIPAATSATVSRDGAGNLPSTVQNERKGSESSQELRIKASSKHLSLASRHFKDLAKWEWSNPNQVQPDGRFHFRLQGHSAKAVIIAMDIIHGRGSRVPRVLDLETLTEVAVFVDEFQCYEAVEVYAERWIGQLERSLPESYDRDAVRWVFVSYVFHRPDLFKSITRLAISQGTGPIDSNGLRIREKIASKEL